MAIKRINNAAEELQTQTQVESLIAANASPAGLTLLSTINASAAATVDIFDLFSSTYDYYIIKCTDPTTSGGPQIRMRFKVSGTVITTSTYRSLNWNSNTYATNVASNSGSGTYGDFLSGGALQLSTAAVSSIEIRIDAPLANKYHGVSSSINVVSNTGAEFTKSENGVVNSTSGTLDGIQLLLSVGTITGTFRLYGVTK